jgi:hypothetical protein
MAFTRRISIVAFAGFLAAALIGGASARPATVTGPAVIGDSGLNPKLKMLLRQVAQHYNRPVLVSSGCRSTHGNRRAGGAKHSLHLSCRAADIKLPGVSERSLIQTIRQMPGRGGLGTYCWNSVVHVDVGPRREWHSGGCGRRVAKRHKRNILVARR